MSNYLARLVERSRGDLATARPRLPNRFEDQPSTDLELVDLNESTAPPTTEAGETDGMVTMPSLDESGRPLQPHSMSNVDHETFPPSLDPAHLAASTNPVASPSPPVESSASILPTLVPPEDPPADQSQINSTTSIPGTLEPRTRILVSPSDDQSSLHPPVDPVRATDGDDQGPPTLEAPTVTSITVNEATSPEPTVVEVRIGRIDIQAAPPTTTSAPPRRSPRPARTPQVSLDDYLRRRREG